MQFKTLIEITTEASDKNEAMEIVGEYISGNLVSDVKMKCRTMPVKSFNRAIACSAVFVMIIAAISLLTMLSTRPSQYLPAMPGECAVQPPLKTAILNKKTDADFKKEWMNAGTRQVLNRIKQN